MKEKEIVPIHNLQHRHQSWIMKQRRLSSQQSHSRREGDNLSGLSPSLEPSQQYQTLTASDGKVLCQTAGTDFSDNSANQTLSQLNSRDGVLSGFDRDQQHLETVGHDAIAPLDSKHAISKSDSTSFLYCVDSLF